MPKRPKSLPEEVLDRELRRMWEQLEQGTPKHLFSTYQRLQDGARPNDPSAAARKKDTRRAG